MISKTNLLDISLHTDMNKLNKYIKEQQQSECNPLIKLINDAASINHNKFLFYNYVNEYIKVLNDYVKNKYHVSNTIYVYDRMEDILLKFRDTTNYFMQIKRYSSFYIAIQRFEAMKDKIVTIVDDYYTNLNYADDYANEFLDKMEGKLKRYRSIDSDSIKVIRKQFKHHINFYIEYKKFRVASAQLDFASYPYWNKDYKMSESDLIEKLTYGMISSKRYFIDNTNHLSYKDALLVLNSKLSINKEQFVDCFPEKVYSIYQSRKILNELSQNY